MLNSTGGVSLCSLEPALGSEVKPGSRARCSAQYPHHCFGISHGHPPFCPEAEQWTEALSSSPTAMIVQWAVSHPYYSRTRAKTFAFSPFRTCLSCVLTFNAFSGCRISGNLPGEALLESEKPVGHLWSVSGVGSKCLLSCECIYRASVLNRQGKGGGGERKSLAQLVWVHVRSEEIQLKRNLRQISVTYSLCCLCA